MHAIVANIGVAKLVQNLLCSMGRAKVQGFAVFAMDDETCPYLARTSFLQGAPCRAVLDLVLAAEASLHALSCWHQWQCFRATTLQLRARVTPRGGAAGPGSVCVEYSARMVAQMKQLEPKSYEQLGAHHPRHARARTHACLPTDRPCVI